MSKKINDITITILNKKAKKSSCKWKISAIALSSDGAVLGRTCNKKRFTKKGGGLHAEMLLMAKYGKLIKTIIICRVNKNGKILPLDPCPTCKLKAYELNIKIHSLKPKD
jgi:hypothetical protein